MEDSRERFPVDRRQLLVLAGMSATQLAGCSGGGQEDGSPTRPRTEDTETSSRTAADTESSGPTATDSTAETRTDTPTGSLTLGCRDDARELPDQSTARYEVESWHEVAEVWPGTPVGFALYTHDDQQFVGFYGQDRRMTIGQRRLGCGSAWEFVRLDTKVLWDSHNYITMTVDDDGYLHVSGNMHVTPLIYFRSKNPLDVTTLTRVDEMVGSREDEVTYPEFFRGPDGELIFTYRDGSSGDGDQIYNVYDHETRTWDRLLDEPLIRGEANNAYINGPTRGPDEYYHMVWVWRRTYDAATNHDLSYARSTDLVNWETSTGRDLSIPITLDTAEIVDPVPVNGGMINGNTRIGFDTQDRVILSYHKFGPDGDTQIYNARREENGWAIYQTTDWDYRWEFGGGGSIEFEIGLSGVSVDEQGRLLQSYNHVQQGSGTWVLDEETLTPVGELKGPDEYPDEIRELGSVAEEYRDDITFNTAWDLGEPPDSRTQYGLLWRTLERNRDRARRMENVPDPTTLRLFKFVRNEDATRTVVTAEDESESPLDGAMWIWYPELDEGLDAIPAETRYFRRSFTIPDGKSVTGATLTTTVDNEATVYLNGQELGDTNDWETVVSFDVGSRLAPENALAVRAKNTGGPAGVIGRLRVDYDDGTSMTVVTDDTWKSSKEAESGWNAVDFDAADWSPVTEIHSYGDGPWGIVGL